MSIDRLVDLLGNRDLNYVRQGISLLEVMYQEDPSILDLFGAMKINQYGIYFPNRELEIYYPRYVSLELLCMFIRAGHPELDVIKQLHLGDMELTTIPDEIRQLTAITSISLGENYQFEFPSWLSEFTQLRSLKMADMNLQKIPDVIGDLKSLVELNIAINPLVEFPQFLCELPLLEDIEMRMTGISELPDEIENLQALRSLHCGGSTLQKVPDTIGHLKNLEKLVLNANRLTFLPDSIGELTSLKKLYLGRNPLQELPETIGQLGKLEYLQLMFPEGKEPIIPDSISNLGEKVVVVVRDDNEAFYNRLSSLLPNIKKVDPEPMLFGSGVY